MAAMDIAARLAREGAGEDLPRRVAALTGCGAWGTLLDALCRGDGNAAYGFLHVVEPDAGDARDPRVFVPLLRLVEALRAGTLRCRVETREAWLARPGCVSHPLAVGHPFVLVPAGDGPASEAPHVIAAFAANVAEEAASRARSEALRPRREAAQARRAARAAGAAR